MNDTSLNECIKLIKDGRKIEARKLLQNILESDLQNLNGWYWYIETFDEPEEKFKALRLCLKYNPDNQKIQDALRAFEIKYPQAISKTLSGKKPVTKKVQQSAFKKSNKGLLIMGVIFGIGIIGITYISAINILSRDKLATTISTPKFTNLPSKTNTPKPFTGKWEVNTYISEFDNSKTTVLSLDAENFVEGWLATTLPTLVLRCKEREMNVYVDLGTQSNVEYGRFKTSTVRLRFDKNQAFEMVADESTDGESLFFRDPYGMIIAMLQSQEMIFGFTPFNADPAVTSFDLRGLKNIIEPLKQSCNWNGARPTLPPLKPTTTATSTATALPFGSALTISGISIGNWKLEIEKIITAKSVSSYGNTTKAGGQFVLIFLRVTNLGNDPRMFIGYGAIQVRDAEGINYDEDGSVSVAASEMYDVSFGTMIQPGDTSQKIVAFDLPLNSEFYLLISGSLADNNEQNLLLEIPK